MGTEELLRNPGRAAMTTGLDSNREPLEFHRKLPGYAPTPLIDAPSLATALGVHRVLVKVESDRFGLPAFKMLGASWATYRSLVARLGAEPEWSTLDDLRVGFAPLGELTLAAATDGNHGRAVARMARLLGYRSKIFVPDDMVAARIEAIRGEGADVTVVQGTYDDAVALSALAANDRCLVISDTSWPGYVDPPTWVIEGYATIFAEIADAIDCEIDVVFLPAGVGAFAAAGVAHYRNTNHVATLVSVEPADADCVLESCRAGRLVEVPGPHRSCMVGLNCGNASLIAFPVLHAGLDWCIAIDDERAEDAMRRLDAEGIVAGETGSAALAGGLGVVAMGGARSVGLTADADVLMIVTEGATDPANYERVVGHPPDLDRVGE
jgi:diaminopropionate ammonia-lyase